MQPERRFLTADWRNLVMLNYQVEPSVLAGRVPAGCELDSWAERTVVSVVGFQFLRTRVLGVPIPFHRNFEEVNLRFYVRRKTEGNWRRGVVFIKELVPKFAIAYVARHAYGENYEALPMRHSVTTNADQRYAAYQWFRGGTWEGLSASFSGSATIPLEGGEETFISEHYWGYSQQRDRSTIEYQVEHPQWRVWRATAASFTCDVAAVYGSEFVEPLSGSPSTAFVADGSAVIVRQGRRLG